MKLCWGWKLGNAAGAAVWQKSQGCRDNSRNYAGGGGLAVQLGQLHGGNHKAARTIVEIMLGMGLGNAAGTAAWRKSQGCKDNSGNYAGDGGLAMQLGQLHGGNHKAARTIVEIMLGMGLGDAAGTAVWRKSQGCKDNSGNYAGDGAWQRNLDSCMAEITRMQNQ